MASSEVESAACKITTSSGFSQVNKYLRSVIMSPTSLYLFAALNSANLDAPDTKRIEDLFERPLPVLTDTHADLLINAMNAADAASRRSSPSPSKKAKTAVQAGEPAITTELARTISVAIEDSGAAALAEWYVHHPQPEMKRKAQMDLVVYDKKNDWIDDEKLLRCYDAYAYVKIGICPQEDDANLLEMWWEKMDQLLNYLNAVCVEKYNGAARGRGKMGNLPGVNFPKHPVILSVLVWSKSRKTSAIGTFVLEWCGTSNKFRMALLSAEICRDIKATSAAFGKVISLIHELTYLRKENLGEGGKKLSKDVWCYLGPDCAKLGETKVS
jgi:hypothetical protein